MRSSFRHPFLGSGRRSRESRGPHEACFVGWEYARGPLFQDTTLRSVREGCSINVWRHESDIGSWEMASRLPNPQLGAHIHSYTGYREDTRLPLRRREVPSGVVTLIISFGEPLRLVAMHDRRASGATFTSFVAGLHTGPAITEHDGRQHGIEVRLTPLGAHALLGVPMHELANTSTGLSDLLGNAAETLATRLAEAPGWEVRFALLDRVLAARIHAGPTPSAAVAYVYRRLSQSSGRAPIEVANGIGWSHRHLVARFREQVGLPPKALARLLRFEQALGFLRNVHRRPLAEVALAAGYYDQAHLNRDFRALAGCTPTEFQAAQLPDEGGVLGR